MRPYSIDLSAMSAEDREVALGKALRKAVPGHRVSHEARRDLGRALAEAGADFAIETAEVRVGDVLFEGRLGTRRADSLLPLGVVTPRYEVVQTADALSPAADLAARGLLDLLGVEVLGGGGQVRVVGLLGAHAVAQLPDGSPDVIAHLVSLLADHTGESTNRGDLISLRLTCLNGNTVRQLLKGVKIRHCSTAMERTAEAARALGLLAHEAEREAESFAAMAEIPLTRERFVQIAAEVLDEVRGAIEPGTDQEAKRRAKRERQVADLLGYFEEGRGNAGRTAWDGYNGFTEWLQARKSKRTLAERFGALNFGAANDAVRAAARRRLLLTR